MDALGIDWTKIVRDKVKDPPSRVTDHVVVMWTDVLILLFLFIILIVIVRVL